MTQQDDITADVTTIEAGVAALGTAAAAIAAEIAARRLSHGHAPKPEKPC